MKTVFDVVIAEDESWSRKLIEQYVRNKPELNLVFSTEDGFSLMSHAQEKLCDIYYLDIGLPGLTGLQFAEKIANRAAIIFITGRKRYALQAFQAGAVDYLLKPISEDLFSEATQKAIHLLIGKSTSSKSYENIESEKEDLFLTLQKKYGMTYQEATICIHIYNGLSRDDICNIFSITPVTLKGHLRSIYSKTIEPGSMALIRHGKLQRLTVFLQELKGH